MATKGFPNISITTEPPSLIESRERLASLNSFTKALKKSPVLFHHPAAAGRNSLNNLTAKVSVFLESFSIESSRLPEPKRIRSPRTILNARVNPPNIAFIVFLTGSSR